MSLFRKEKDKNKRDPIGERLSSWAENTVSGLGKGIENIQLPALKTDNELSISPLTMGFLGAVAFFIFYKK